MPDETLVVEKTEEVVTTVNPFSGTGWKTEPTVIVKEEEKPVIEEKAAEEKPVVETAVEAKLEEKPVASVPEPIKFHNEESEKIFNLIKDGKTDEVYSVLAEQKKLTSVDGADAIKLQLQYQNKDFSPDDINDLFNERYAMPEKPVQDLESDEEFAAKLEKHEKEVQKVQNRITRDAKPAKTELLKLHKEIVLPDIQKETLEPKAPTQEELDNAKKVEELFFADLNEGSKNFNSYSTTFKDEEVEIKAESVVTKEEKDALRPLLKSAYDNLPEFFTQLGWTDKEGKVMGKLVEDLHLLQNRDKVFAKLVSEVGNKRHEASIKSIKNIDYSGRAKSNGDLGATPQEKERAMVNHFFSR